MSEINDDFCYRVVYGNTYNDRETAKNLYPENDLFDERTGRQPEDIIRLLKFIEAKNKVYPIILNLYADGSISVVDGRHRLALISFLKLKNIPI